MTDYIALARECGAVVSPYGGVDFLSEQWHTFAARIAQAAQEDEPVAWAYQETLAGLRETGFLYGVELWREPGARADLVPLYLAPHAVAPAEAAPAQDCEDAVRFRYILECEIKSARQYMPDIDAVGFKAMRRGGIDAARAAQQAPKEPT